jgi:hypothetical protein
MKVTYTGPHDAVDIDDLANDYILSGVENGQTIDVPKAVAEGLLEQGPDHWQSEQPAQTFRTHALADAAAAELGIELADGMTLAEKNAAINQKKEA